MRAPCTDSLGYHTTGSHVWVDFLLTPQGMIPQRVSARSSQLGDGLCAVQYPGEISTQILTNDSAQYSMIPWGD